MLILSVSFSFAQTDAEEPVQEITQAGKKSVFASAARHYAEGKYSAAVEDLSAVEKAPGQSKENLGLAAYWKGICYNRLQDFPNAIASFDKALGQDYKPVDIHYEYGQALYAAEKYQDARLQFRESLKRKFKRAISLYYIGFLSRELGDRKKAVTFFKAIEKLPKEETKDILQASEFQIGDIYLEQVEKSRDAFRAVEKYVIPQYKRALAINEESNLAQPIREKIVELQRKYDLILFNLRNGRPVSNPPYILRASLDNGYDTNVTFAPAETTISKAKQGSLYTKGEVFGKYTFYQDNWATISPELRFNYTYYHHRIPEIYRNDNYYVAPAIRSTYEYTAFNKPASILLDYDFSQSQRDVNAKKKLEFSSRAHSISLGDRFSYFASGETTVRLKYRLFDSYNDASDSKTISLVFEQIIGLKANTLLLYSSYDRTRTESDVFSTDSITVRGDFLMAAIGRWGSPSIGLMLTSTDPVNNRSQRGRELLFNPNARLSKVFGKNWRGSVKYDYQNNNSKDEEGFAYKKSVYGVEVEYLF